MARDSQKYAIGIIGVGMVGTPLARYYEEVHGHERGNNLFLYDIDPKKGYFDDVDKADIVFISVPTPRAPEGAVDSSAVEEAFRMITGEKIIVLKSTVPPGMTEAFQKKYPHQKILFNPEFLTEKRAWEDFLKPDRQIVGFTSSSIDAAHIVLSLLPKAPFMSPWGLTTYRSVKITATEAEIIKYGGNVHFARKVNFANLLAKTSEKFGADYENVRLGLAADFRIGDSHLDVMHGGYRGFGGYCFPKDLDGFIAHLAANGLDDCADLLRKDREFNEGLLAEQGLTLEDVSVHDHEWIRKKLGKNA
ncbi:MAG: UDP-glucose/GDP-mannose dehydrogenase dimerization [candidate division Kazan bacterium GW2011_GWB1_52_7]|uniref:UDP-glucose/GDP-mannose dehydrogenase dimerization n=1 Tax=candidate division Kazan bacterium GW2011_GWB1_52_7 TaxID=1620414 RepID=A0A0G1ZEW8_UNCK3|nr:MAG: UDP-glucose/GDP-mannose dehydrogenase dimerization [candidate division Kazan bacterium GW2011_GWB1_52_7]